MHTLVGTYRVHPILLCHTVTVRIHLLLKGKEQTLEGHP